MNGTLPLFDGLEPEGAPPAGNPTGAPGRGRRAGAGTGPAGLPGQARASRQDASGDQHLRAAWRLSRAMWRFPDHSPQQTRAGLAICHHLQALLAEDPPPPR